MESFTNIKKRRIISGAAFLSAISAFGPSLMTQLAIFSEEFGTRFLVLVALTGLVNVMILSSSWIIITKKEKNIIELTEEIRPGLGYVMAVLFCFCCICFNIGNLCGIVQGLNVLTGAKTAVCAGIAGVLCAATVGNAVKKYIDTSVQFFSFLIIGILIYILSVSAGDSGLTGTAAHAAVQPGSFLIPGVCMLFGSYIPFIGAHRLLSQGIRGIHISRTVAAAAAASSLVTLLMRLLITASDLMAFSRYGSLGGNNPAAQVFYLTLGANGWKLFAIMQIIISLSCTYASTSCFDTFASSAAKKDLPAGTDIILILLCTLVVAFFGRPEKLMVAAGTISGLMTPFTLLILFLAGRKKDETGKRLLPIPLLVTLITVVAATGAYSVLSVF